MFREYIYLLHYLVFAFILAFTLSTIFFLLIFRQNELEKISAYECGFNPFEDAYGRFDIKFYLVAILFLIFDLEVSFLFPWSVNFIFLKNFGFWSMMLFLFVLGIGFLYEWKRGALDW